MDTCFVSQEYGINNLSIIESDEYPTRCNMGNVVNLLKWRSELLNVVKGLSHTFVQCQTLDYEIGPVLVKHTHCIVKYHKHFKSYRHVIIDSQPASQPASNEAKTSIRPDLFNIIYIPYWKINFKLFYYK